MNGINNEFQKAFIFKSYYKLFKSIKSRFRPLLVLLCKLEYKLQFIKYKTYIKSLNHISLKDVKEFFNNKNNCVVNRKKYYIEYLSGYGSKQIICKFSNSQHTIQYSLSKDDIITIKLYDNSDLYTRFEENVIDKNLLGGQNTDPVWINSLIFDTFKLALIELSGEFLEK